MKVLISTIWKGSAVIQAIKLFSPNKVFFIADEPVEDIRNNSINMIKEIFPNLEYKTVPTKIYDIVGIAKSVMDIIESETGNEIIVHISEGRKTMSLGLLFGAYVKRELVSSAYYITEETNTPIQLPLVKLKLSKQKKGLLQKIDENITSISELAKKLKIKAPTVYVHMKELRDDGFLNKENKLTEIGRIILLNN
ncbi:MAG: Transcriptional regulator, ArsR family [archaeon GW2011_AR20]|nr:MAG: Transcriptional regulator, ArsR family [archaeon GW2011_AR20]MBS3160638.1 CRISPR locus-related DNA-binding protein [Candidatus Woesearchaeota archaeon]